MKRTNGFSAVEIMLVIVVVALAGVLGWVYFNQNSKDEKVATTKETTTQKVTAPECKGDKTGGNGYFCVSSIPVNVPVPDEFSGKLRPILVNKNAYLLSGYSAEIGTEKSALYTLSISTETVRDGDIGVSHQLSTTSFDSKNYTLTTTVTKEAVPTVKIDGITFFRGSIGDAGVLTTTYVGVVDNKLVKISLASQSYMGPPEQRESSSIDRQTLYDQFDKDVKQLTVKTS